MRRLTPSSLSPTDDGGWRSVRSAGHAGDATGPPVERRAYRWDDR